MPHLHDPSPGINSRGGVGEPGAQLEDRGHRGDDLLAGGVHTLPDR